MGHSHPRPPGLASGLGLMKGELMRLPLMAGTASRVGRAEDVAELDDCAELGDEAPALSAPRLPGSSNPRLAGAGRRRVALASDDGQRGSPLEAQMPGNQLHDPGAELMRIDGLGAGDGQIRGFQKSWWS